MIRETIALVEQDTRSALRVGRLEAQHPEYVALDELVTHVLDDLRRYELLDRCQVECALAAEQPAVIFGDRDDFVEILRNILLNALQSMDGRPERRLRIVLDHEGASRARLAISDTGVGISPEHIRRVFDPFFSTKSGKGSGLGLAIVKRLVEKYGGALALRSELRSGTTVEISLPTVPWQAEATSGSLS